MTSEMKNKVENEEINENKEQENLDFNAQLLELDNKYKRILAEYDNYRKRTAKEKEGIFKDAAAFVATAFLPVIDSMDRASQTADNEGIKLILKQIDDVLKSLDIKPTGVVGEQFDPNKHEAVTHIEDESAGENTIVEVMRKGYIMGERVIRCAFVNVAN